jgi:hypothetical protein
MTMTLDTYKPELDERRMRILAREIALDIHPLEEIILTYKIGDIEWDRLQRSEQFNQLLQEAIEHWNSALTIKERAELRAQAMIEFNLLTANEMINDRTVPAPARVEMFKAVCRVAKMGDKELVSEAGQRVKITINMGDKKVAVNDITPAGNFIEGESTHE